MAEKLDFSFQVRQTTIQVRYGDITHLIADAFVSSDDVHLSAASGLSRAIREAAGAALRADIRKFALPLELGSVIVTGGGDLPVKYVFHATTISFDQQPFFDQLIPQIIRQVLVLANALGITTLALPMVNAGIVSVPPATLLQVIAQGAACYLATYESSVKHITLAVYDDAAQDHVAAEARMLAELSDVRNRIESWQMQTQPLNERLLPLIGAISALSGNDELRQKLQLRVDQLERQLGDVFDCPGSLQDAPALTGAVARVGALNDRGAYEKARERLSTLLADLQEDLRLTRQTQRKFVRNRLQLEGQAASFGLDVPLTIVNSLDAANAQVEGKQREIDLLENQLRDAQQQLESLDRTWQERLAIVTSDK